MPRGKTLEDWMDDDIELRCFEDGILILKVRPKKALEEMRDELL